MALVLAFISYLEEICFYLFDHVSLSENTEIHENKHWCDFKEIYIDL